MEKLREYGRKTLQTLSQQNALFCGSLFPTLEKSLREIFFFFPVQYFKNVQPGHFEEVQLL